jgi:hypothetical protein
LASDKGGEGKGGPNGDGRLLLKEGATGSRGERGSDLGAPRGERGRGGSPARDRLRTAGFDKWAPAIVHGGMGRGGRSLMCGPRPQCWG